MDIFDVLSLIGGLALFLFGMDIMGNSLEKKASGQLKNVLEKITRNRVRGFLLGMGVTAVIQSSSATTVMVVGFVNSGIMALGQAINIIMGANIGTTVTAWILSLVGIEGDNFFVQLCKPSSFVPVLALIGVVLSIFIKKTKLKDTGYILLGFATLMAGMDSMSAAVEGLKDVPEFTNLLTLFTNPVLGVIVGAVFTAVIQSSSASVGILQALSSTGAITFGAAIPIIMGQNIGTCITAMLSALGANKNAKRTAFVHLYFNLIGSAVLLIAFYGINAIVEFEFTKNSIDELGIAIVHTAFNVICTVLWFPFTRVLEKLAVMTVKDTEEKEKYEMLDERLLSTPAVAVERCRSVAGTMAEISIETVHKALKQFSEYNEDEVEKINKNEKKVDKYEDKLGSYLVKLCACELTDEDSAEATKLLHAISDLERLSDHAASLTKSIQEIRDKKLDFSGEAKQELSVMIEATNEILDLTYDCFANENAETAVKVEPLEQVVDKLQSHLKSQHVKRLRKGECTIELGFILSDITNNLERVADHCSNIAGLMLEMEHGSMSVHKYLRNVKKTDEFFAQMYESYKTKYRLS